MDGEGKKFTALRVGVIAIVLLALVFVFWRYSINKPQDLAVQNAPEVQGAYIKGNPDAKVLLEEYADFQCPACALFNSVLAELLNEFPDGLKITMHEFPLTQIHFNALPSAQAAEAAGAQGKFWEMADQLYANQSEWNEASDPLPIFKTYAQRIGLDLTKFQSDYGSDAVLNKIKADRQKGIEANVQATPTFFINGVKLDSPRTYDEFRNTIAGYIEKAKSQ